MNMNIESVITVGRGRVSLSNSLENESSGSLNSLRRPYKHPPEVQDMGDKSGGVKSNLSAEAPEFIPKSNIFVQNTNYTKTKENSETYSAPSVSEYNEVPDDIMPHYKFSTHPLILCVSDLVVRLSFKPHRFMKIATDMTSLFSNPVSKDIMKEVVSVIIEQGIGEPNFRFNGGRLCQHLSKNVTQSFEGFSFRQLLLMRCQEEYSHRDHYLQYDQPRLCGFTLFLADIFSNVLTKEGHRFEILRKGLITLLLLLIKQPSDVALKCVAQVLKGSGRLLDKDEDKNFNELMYMLKDITLTSKIADHIVSLLLSVIEYRASDWGQIKEPPSSSNPLDSKLGQSGRNATESPDEVQCFEENYSSSESEDDMYQGVYLEIDEMEDEIADAFEEFINSNQ